MREKDMMFMVNIRFKTGGTRSYRKKGKAATERHIMKVRKQKNVADVSATQINE